MVSKNNLAKQLEDNAKRVPHYGLRKLSVGVASVLLSTTLYFGATASADTNEPVSSGPETDTNQTTKTSEPYTTNSEVPLSAKASKENVASRAGNPANNVNGSPAANSQAGQATNQTEPQATKPAGPTQGPASAKPTGTPATSALFVNLAEQPAAQPEDPLAPHKEGDAVKYEAGTTDVDDAYNHYVHRTINITDPTTGTKSNQVQTIHFIRRDAKGNAGYHDKDSNLVYVDWSVDPNSNDGSNIFKAVDLPQHDGYQAYDQGGSTEVSIDGKQVVQQTVTPSTLDSTVNVAYRAVTNFQKIQIAYNGNVLKDFSITGTNGETKKIDVSSIVPPDGYEFVPGQAENIPSSVTFNGTAKTPIILQAQPIVITISASDLANHPAVVPGTKNVAYPSINMNYLQRTISRIVTIHNPDGTVDGPKVYDTYTFKRTATFNAVNGEITYSDWSNNGSINAAGITVPDIDGYIADIPDNGKAITLTPGNQNIPIVVTYVKAYQNVQIHYIDPNNGSEITTGNIPGATGTSGTYTVDQMNEDLEAGGDTDHFELPSGIKDLTYTIDPNNLDINITLANKFYHVPADADITSDSTLPDGYTAYPDNINHDTLNKTVKRTITVKGPNGTTTINQHVDFSRGATINLGLYSDDPYNTNAVVFDAWTPSSASLPAYAAPVIPGYTPDHSVSETPVTADSTDLTDTITYTANTQNGQITYNDESGKQISSTPLTGKTGDTITINPQVPAGWELVPGQKYPKSVTATADGIPGVTLTIRHHMITVTTNDVPNPGDSKPGNTNKKPGDGTPNKTISHEDLNKTITRSFTVVQPDGTSNTKKQNLSFQRVATIDDVTGDVTYSDWGTDGAAFTAETVPTFGGYTSHVTSGNYGAYTPTQDQINNWTDPDITVTYTANTQNGEITYVDRQGNTIGTTPLSGQTGEQVAITPKAPAGWKISDGQSIPATVTATANGIAGPSILVEHATVTVNPSDEPNPGDKKPGNPTKKPGDHTPNTDITYSDLHKSTTRTITINDPHNGQTVDRETISFNRIATIDDVTGDVTYGNWTVAPDSTQDRFNNVTYPVIPGYTMNATAGDHSAKILSQADINNWTDPNITVNYTANNQTGKISYVGPDGQEVAHTDLTGPTDANVDVKNNIHVPTNWKIVPGQNIPDTIKAGTSSIPTVTINIEHDTITVTSADPKTPSDKLPDGTNYPTGVSQNDLNKTITRTINITKPGEATNTTTQKTSFNRSATIDLVNHKITYNDWTQNGNNGWVAVNVPVVDGYTPSVSAINEIDVTPNTADITIDVTYTANTQDQVINYVDGSGKVVKSDNLTGKTGDQININVNVPAHYVEAPGQTIPASVTLKTNNPVINIKVTPKMDDITDPSQLTKTISRTVTINVPHQTPIIENQAATFTRTGQHNEVTGEDSYTDWTLSNNGLKSVNVPNVDGYTPSQTTVSGIDNPGVNDQLQNVTVNYTADAQSLIINYVDEQGNKVGSDTVDGVTDQTVAVNPKAPEHYTIVSGQNIPANVTLKSSNKPISVKVTPKLDPITDPTLLNKTITRTITINKPNTQAQVITQEAKFTRTGNTNEVTGKQAFSNWTLASNDWTEVDAPSIPGYTPDKSKIDAINVTPDMTNTTETINYLTNAQTGKISYVDDNGNEISHTDLAGQTGETININPQAPVDWKIAKGQNIPKSVVAGPDSIPTVTVKIEHDTIKVTPDQPKNPSDTLPDGKNYPKGVTKDDLNKTIRRTITINIPNKPAQVINQKADFKRTATIDLVNHEVTYGDWMLDDSNLNHVDVPTVPGYTASQTTIDGVNNPTVNTELTNITVNYTANEQGQVINYVDPAENTVKTDTVPGHTGETIDINVNVPDHYVLVPGQTVPSNVTLTDHNNPITIQVQPKIDQITDPDQLTKTISRTIIINVPGQEAQTVNQSASFTRTGTHNEVTGQDSFSDWTLKNNSLVAVSAPTVDGYTADITKVDAVANPTVDTKLNNVTINYTANGQTQVINYVDDNGKTVKTDNVPGKTGDKVEINVQVPDHYVLAPGQEIPTNVTLTNQNTPITVKVTPKIDDVTDPAQLNKTVTRKITVTNPIDGAITIVNQEATFKRTGKTNEVTGQTNYSDWQLVDNKLKDFKPSLITGYTPSINDVPAVENPTADQSFKDINITYTANGQTQVINYVDPAGNVVKTDNVLGKTGDKVEINVQVPDHYVLVPGQEIPTNITLKDQNTPINVQVTPKLDNITDINKLRHVFTRTITINLPGQEPRVITEHATFYRHGTHNEVTGKDAFTDWQVDRNGLSQVNIPHVPGYTSDYTGDFIPKITNPTVDMPDQNIVVNYTTAQQKQVINYVDDNGKTVKTDTVSGKTGDSVKITPNVPDHYVLVPGQEIPTNVTLKDNNDPIDIRVTPKIDQITDLHELRTVISRTITINRPNMKQIVLPQKVAFERTGTYNEVTGQKSYSDWKIRWNRMQNFRAPQVEGYKPTIEMVPGVKNPTPNTTVSDVVINYDPIKQNIKVNYVDDSGNTVKTDTLTGKTGETIKTGIQAPDHYVIVPGQTIPDQVTVSPSPLGNQPITVKVTPKIDPITDPNLTTKKVGRTIRVVAPDSDVPQSYTQFVTYTRTGTINEVTGKATYTDWVGGGDLPEFTPVNVPGYTPSMKVVQTVKNVPVDYGMKNIEITYTANTESQVINYVDPDGKTVKTDKIPGKTGDTVKITSNIPDHYVLVPSQEIPSEVTITGNNPAISIKVTPKMDPVTDPSQTTKTVTRKVTITTPDGKSTNTTQTATFTRNGETNEVTGETTFTDWTLKNNGWTKIDVPSVPGYKPSISEVPAVNVAPDTKSQDVDITYTANGQTQVINYVDGNGKTVKSDKVTGKTGDTVQIKTNVPDHYELVPGQQIPDTVKLTNNSTPITVKVQPKMDPITDPAELHKTITRTITINVPGKDPQVIKQEAKFIRTGEINEVSGQKTYSDWKLESNGWTAVDAPAIDGYAPSHAKAEAVNVTPDTANDNIVINYTTNDETVTIKYIDKDGNPVGTQTIPGKQGDTVNIKLNVPDGYEVDGNVPSTAVINGQTIEVTVKKIETPKPSTPSTQPSTPNEKPSTPSEQPTMPSQKPEAPAVKPSTPTAQPAATASTPQEGTVSTKAPNATIFAPTAKNMNRGTKLPQTGNSQKEAEALGLLGTLGIGLSMFGFKKRKHEEK